jgi:hypothetical protein
MIAAMVTVRPELEAIAAFSDSTRTNVSQVVITGPGAPSITTVDDLAGQAVFVRKASAYYDSITKLNAQLKARGKPVVIIDEAPRRARRRRHPRDGQCRARPDHGRGRLPGRVLEPGVHRHHRSQGRSPCAPAAAWPSPFARTSQAPRRPVNDWLRKHQKGDAFRNTIERRYLQNVKYVKNAAADGRAAEARGRGRDLQEVRARYKVDYLLMAAQGYQESTLDQNVKSPVGAFGRDAGHAANREGTERRQHLRGRAEHPRRREVHALHDGPVLQGRADGRPEQDADDLRRLQRGPGRMRQLRRETEKRGLDPNLWFNNVERIASERIGRETVTYVSNIYKYYITYRLVLSNR